VPRHALTSISLLDADPDLGRLLPPDRVAEARHMLIARRHAVPAGPWADPQLARVSGGHLGLLVLDGLLAHETAMEDTVSTHLLGQGDIARPWQTDDPGQLLRAERRWTVLAPATVAVLDARLGASLCRYPEMHAAIVDRLADQMQRMAMAQAIARLTGVDRRLLALFWHLAERWGRVAPQGVQVPLNLAHGVLADLIGARRPTVSTALGKLAARGELLRLPDGSWLLTGAPVGAPRGDAARVIHRRRRRPTPLHVVPQWTSAAGADVGAVASGSSAGGGVSLGNSGVAMARAMTTSPNAHQ
jgi:CRP/FNR family cyclic AMP-dependent transcriptional regulator